MANSYKALTLALFLCLGTAAAHAGYAQAKPPQGWSTSGFNGSKAANNTSFYPGGVRTSASINVGGKAVTMPANMRFSSNAPRVAASVLYLHPGIRTAASIAGWLGLAGLVYDAASGLWQKPESENDDLILSDGYRYKTGTCTGFYTARAAADCAFNRDYPKYQIGKVQQLSETVFKYFFPNGRWIHIYIEKVPNSDCPVGWYVTPDGCVENAPSKSVTEQEFLDALTQHPMPAEVPRYIPAPLPVELPEMPPAFVPTGNPVPNPDYNPQAEPSPQNQPYIQPGVKIVPTPTTSSPWQVDLQPVNRPSETPEPKPEPEIDPLPEPGTDPQPGGPGTTPPGETPATPGLCDQYPDILACEKLDLEEPEKEELPEKDISEQFSILGGFYSSATCPAFPSIDMLPGLSWQPFCDQLARIRPLVLAFAWLSAVMIILKYGRK